MLSALKLIAAAVVVALFGGFLLAGVLTAPDGDQVVPAAVTESPSPMATEESSSGMDAFPTGIFISVDTGRELFEFHGDGTGLTRDPVLTLGRFTYAVDGDVYTAGTPPGALNPAEPDDYGPGTYRWDYDGERLTFELIEDPSDRRVTRLAKTFRQIEDPREVMVASRDLDVGDSVRAWLTFVDADEAGPDAYTSKAEYVGHVAAVPIAKGQPITPDLLELRPSE